MFFPKKTTLLQKALFISSCLCAFILLASFMHQYAVDVLMADRIDTWNSLFKNKGLWKGFISQHGPHRVGFLFIFSKIGYILGHEFDTRFDLYVNAFVIWTLIPLGFWVKYRITQIFNWYDLLVPLLITASWQWATLIINPHIHVMLPLFTLLFAALILSKYRNNLLLNCFLIFSATFSVYALFAAIIFIALQTTRLILQKKWIHLISILVFSTLTLLFYFHDFKLVTLDAASDFNLTNALKAPILILSNFFYLKNWISLFTILALGLLIVKNLWGFNLKNTNNVATLLIIGSAISFIFFQAIGRSGEDPIVFSAPRYYTELSLFIWVIIITASKHNKNKVVPIAIFVGFSWMLIQPNNPKRGDWKAYSQKLEKLKECVLITEDFHECNRNPKLIIHGNPEKSKVVEKWLILEQRKQVFFQSK